MKKILVLSVIAFAYIFVFRITDFQTGDIASATILLFGVPVFVTLTVILFLISLYFTVKENFSTKPLYFVSCAANFTSLT